MRHAARRLAATFSLGERVMPIRSLVESGAFDPEAVEIISMAFDAALIELGLVDRSDPIVALVAERIIAFAREGERDPVKLRELALKSIRR
jgi:hypothetical protein